MASKSYSIAFNILGNLDPSLLAALQKAQKAIGSLNGKTIANQKALQRAQAMQAQIQKYKDLAKAIQQTRQQHGSELLKLQNLAPQIAAQQKTFQQAQAAHKQLLQEKTARQNNLRLARDAVAVKQAELKAAKLSADVNSIKAAQVALQNQRAAALQAAQALKEINNQIKQSNAGLREQKTSLYANDKSFSQAAANAARLQAQLQSQQQQLSQLRLKLPTGNLAAAEAALRSQIDQTTNALNRQIAALERRDRFNAAKQNLSDKYSEFQNAVDTAQTIMNPFKDAAQNAMTFERSLSRLKSLTQMENIRNGNTAQVEAEMASMTQMIERLGMTTEYTRNEIAEAANYYGMSGWSSKQINAALPSTVDMASIAQLPIARVADMFSDDLTIMGIKAGEKIQLSNGQMVDAVSHFSDAYAFAITKANLNMEQLHNSLTYNAPAMRLAGMSQGDIFAANMIAANAGLKGSVSGTAFRTGVIRMMAPAKKGAAALEELGLTASEAQKEYAAAGEALSKLGLTMSSSVTDKILAMKQAWDSNKLLGEEGRAANAQMLNDIIGKNAFSTWANLFEDNNLAQMAQWADRINSGEIGGWTQETASVMRDNTYTQIEYMKSALDALQGSVGQALLPSINAAAQAITPLITSMTEWISQNQAAVQWAALLAAALSTVIVVGAGLALVSAAISFIASGLAMLTPLVTLLGAAFAFVTSPIFLVVAAIAAVIAIVATLINHADQIKQAFTDAWNHPKGAIVGFCELMKSAINGAVQFVLDKWNALTNALSHPIDAISSLIGGGELPVPNAVPNAAQIQTAQAVETQAVQVNAAQVQMPEMQAVQDVAQPVIEVVQPVADSLNVLPPSAEMTASGLENVSNSSMTTSPAMDMVANSSMTTSPAVDAVGAASQGATGNITALAGVAVNAASGIAALSGAASAVAGALSAKAAEISSIVINVPQVNLVPVNVGVPTATGHLASGGIFPKGEFLTTFAEDSPEAAIPLTKSARAFNLWSTVGNMLGFFPENKKDAATFPALNLSTPNLSTFNLSTPNLSTNNLATNEPINISITVNISGNANEESVRNGIQQALPSVRDFASELAAYRHEQARRSFA